jgi:EAL domain-containing protein (putative c-di-GMP-specific phosphodiesterase class I)
MVCRVLDVLLTNWGLEAICCDSGAAALEQLERIECDVVVSDIGMPDISGIELLRAIRSRDHDLPVILMTGNPDVETAVKAVEFGANRYLSKPIEPAQLLEVVTNAGRLSRLARIKRDLQSENAGTASVAEQDTLTAQFDDALRLLQIHFQPIVNYRERTLIAYEVLCRSRSEHMPSPWHLFSTAERLGRVLELGREIRRITAERIGELDDDTLVFVNLHPEELCDEELTEPGGLREHSRRVVLEVTERQTLDSVTDAGGRIAALKAAGFRIAVDDLGAGYAGLSSFVQLDPDIVKVDMSLVRGVDSSPKKLKLIESLVSLCAEMGTHVVVEGVETPEERDALAATGCNWMQGYLFGRPMPMPEKPIF